MALTPREMPRPEQLEGDNLFDRERDLAPERKAKLLEWLEEEADRGGDIFRDPETFANEAAAVRELLPNEATQILTRIEFPRNREGIGPKNPLEQLAVEVQTRGSAAFARNFVRLFPEAADETRDDLMIDNRKFALDLKRAWARGDGAEIAERLSEARALYPKQWESMELDPGKTAFDAREEAWNKMTEALTMRKANDEWGEFAEQARRMAEIFPERKNELGLMEPPVREALIERRGASTVFDANLAYLSR